MSGLDGSFGLGKMLGLYESRKAFRKLLGGEASATVP